MVFAYEIINLSFYERHDGIRCVTGDICIYRAAARARIAMTRIKPTKIN